MTTPLSTALPPCHAIIPARYASSRFPGKPLAQLLGKPMIWHVFQRARQCPELQSVTVATDDARIAQACAGLDIPAVLTSPDHQSGSDRVCEAAGLLGLNDDAVVVNIQGDEPTLEPAMLSALVEPFAQSAVQVTTLAAPLPVQDVADPNRVKVVFTQAGRALYFSRAAIPFSRDCDARYFGHVGLYAFRLPALRRFTALPMSPLEDREKLEQLRLLENGVDIHVVITTHHGLGVDRPEDLVRAAEILTGRQPA